MTRPGFLDNPHVRHWLGDVEPAWIALTHESFNALQQEPSARNTALRLASDLTVNELNASAVARNALHLPRHAARVGGLKLTAKGSLARAAVAEMIDLFDWPDFDKTNAPPFGSRSSRGTRTQRISTPGAMPFDPIDIKACSTRSRRIRKTAQLSVLEKSAPRGRSRRGRSR